jgi:hypothetical protein|tara:strand:- start:450 stop:1037 length:588 start_codon:yes stop_codon:yes gene_type:complete
MEDVIYIPTTRFVYFDEFGSLLSISNSKGENGNFIEVDYAQVANLVSGKEQLHQYCITFDIIIKTYVLEFQNTDDINNSNNYQLHYIDRTSSELIPDLTITQHIPNKEWVVTLDDTVRKNFSGKNISVNLSLMFSVTGYNEVQSLERVIIIEISKLISNDCVKIPFTSQIESSDSALSVYTIKRLESYHHRVIND